MISALIAAVIWPPRYYILRDRIPFFLTIIYLYRSRLPQRVQNVLGYYLYACTLLVSVASFGLYYLYDDLTLLAGIHWSPPSPIEWGVFIAVSVPMLYRRGIKFLDSFYLCFISAMAGGWLYEFVPLIASGFNFMVFFKVNAVKVFFIEFQVLCVPIMLYLIKTKYEYHQNRWLLPVGVLSAFFYSTKLIIEHFVRQFYIYSWRWYIRVPAILFLFVLLDCVRGVKEVEPLGN